MSRERLIELAKANIEHSKAGTIPQAESIFRVAPEQYYDPEIWDREVKRIFRRLPLMLSTSAELKGPGSYKAIEAANVPVLLTRDKDGQVRAFLNMCRHRGALLFDDGETGTARRFTCPYHGWNYDNEGQLVGVLNREDFGPFDTDNHGLTPLPVEERAGLIWVILDPSSELSFDAFLSGYDKMLELFGFEDWYFVAKRKVAGPNWKVAYDGYLDLYHLPVLHKNTFGPNFPNRAIYDAWGPHQRATSPNPKFLEFEDTPEADWPIEKLIGGVWTIFPHVSIAGFDTGARGVLLSQLFPGSTPGSSVTVQNYLLAEEPDEETLEQAHKQADFLEYVVTEEDYATGLKIQAALETGLQPDVMFGLNEGGGRRFHDWVQKLSEAETPADTAALFTS